MNSKPALFTFKDVRTQQGGRSSLESPCLDERHVAELTALFQSEHKKVVRFLVAKTGSWAEARDVAAQAFAQLLSMREPQKIKQMKAYIYQTASNIATDRGRQAAIHRRIHKVVKHELPTITPSPEPVAVEAERLMLLQTAIGLLDPVLRTAIRLRFWEKWSFEQIADYFARKGISVDDRTIRRWVAKALKQCERIIREGEGEGSPS